MITGGHGSSTRGEGGNGGTVYIYGGEGSGASETLDLGGNIEMYGGVAAASTGGSFIFHSGLGAASSSGFVSLITMNAGTEGISGSITLSTGTKFLVAMAVTILEAITVVTAGLCTFMVANLPEGTSTIWAATSRPTAVSPRLAQAAQSS